MTTVSWDSLMKLGVNLRDGGDDKQALDPFYGAAFYEGASDEQAAKAHQALMITYRKLGMLVDARIHGLRAMSAAEATGETLLRAQIMRDYAEVIHEMALRQRGKWRRNLLDKAADMLLASRKLIRSLYPSNIAEDAATTSFLALVKYHLNDGGRSDAAKAVTMLDNLSEPHHVYHVNALIRYIRMLPWNRRSVWAKKALALLPKAGLESRHWEVLIARHFGDRGYRLIKRGYQLIKR